MEMDWEANDELGTFGPSLTPVQKEPKSQEVPWWWSR